MVGGGTAGKFSAVLGGWASGAAGSTAVKELRGEDGRPTAEALDTPFPKFRRDEDILIMVGGGTAGKFSAVLGGWASGAAGSTAVQSKSRRNDKSLAPGFRLQASGFRLRAPGNRVIE